ncbi:MAG: PA2779 family protein [Thiotrichales bacterium]
MNSLRRMIALASCGCLMFASLPVPATTVASPLEGLVTTAEVIGTDRDALAQLLTRESVRAGLLAHGVDPTLVEARLAALTPAESQLLAQRLDELPAGAADVVGVLFAVFVILLVTDILGLTKVFPFTRSIH